MTDKLLLRDAATQALALTPKSQQIIKDFANKIIQTKRDAYSLDPVVAAMTKAVNPDVSFEDIQKAVELQQVIEIIELKSYQITPILLMMLPGIEPHNKGPFTYKYVNPEGKLVARLRTSNVYKPFKLEKHKRLYNESLTSVTQQPDVEHIFVHRIPCKKLDPIGVFNPYNEPSYSRPHNLFRMTMDAFVKRFWKIENFSKIALITLLVELNKNGLLEGDLDISPIVKEL